MFSDRGTFETRQAERLAGPAELAVALLEPRPPFDIDWQASASTLTEAQRLIRLAHLKAILPLNNASEGRTTHDISLENYKKLALQAAGDRQTLDVFLGQVEATLNNPMAGSELLAQQVYWIWAPVAEIAGLDEHKTALEDAALKVLLPEEHAQLQQEYEDLNLEGSNSLLERTQDDIRQLIESLELSPGFHYELQARTKSKYSAWQKKQKADRRSTELFDLLGLRIIIDGDDELRAIGQCNYLLSALAEYFEPEGEAEDYIAQPKATGYQSLHQTFRLPNGQSFEMQIRTRAMHDRATADSTMSHQVYDATYKTVPGKLKRGFRHIPRHYRWRDEATTFIRENDGQTEGILGDTILFFAPDGNLYPIATGATVLDASFRIHSRRALKTKAAYRQGRLVGLADEISHGDVLEIKYRKHYPTDPVSLDGWREVAKTAATVAHIRKYQRRLRAGPLLEAGRQRIAEMVAKLGLENPLSLLDTTDRQLLARQAGVPDFDKLLEIIGAGQKNGKPGRIAHLIMVKSGLVSALDEKETESGVPLADQEVLTHIIIPNTNGMPACRVADCCSERIKRGETVLARSSRRRAVMQLHRAGCSNVKDLEGVYVCGWEER